MLALWIAAFAALTGLGTILGPQPRWPQAATAGTPSAPDAIDPDRIRIVDGDTFAIGSVRYRVRDLDAPELGARAACALEAERGRAAREEARRLVRSAKTAALVTDGETDRFGRTRASLLLDGRDFANLMIRGRHAARFGGRPRDWCVP
jgi:endonuclease YncB( thermonuclease family)